MVILIVIVSVFLPPPFRRALSTNHPCLLLFINSLFNSLIHYLIHSLIHSLRVDDGSYTAVKLISELALMRRQPQTDSKTTTAASTTESTTAASASTQPGRLSDLLLGLNEPEDSVELRFRAV